jgi:SAM-dependent methyltransferase
MQIKLNSDEHRTAEEIREHYEIEKELATKLRDATREERRHLYTAVYDEMLRRVPSHPLLARKTSAAETDRQVASQMLLLGRFLNADSTFLEVGPGDCSLSFEAARHVRKVYAVDVSEEITRKAVSPQNFQLIISDGCSIPVPEESVNVAYSNQLMEHLHPDESLEQLRNIYRALAPGGSYICITPNRLNGPHDVSMYFDSVATGFHLKEYTTSELIDLFRSVGFSKIKAYIPAKGRYLDMPLSLIRRCESFLETLPRSTGKRLARGLPFRVLLDVRLVGTK